jgi:hypothetical protein
MDAFRGAGRVRRRGAVGSFIVEEAIANVDILVGGGILRASVALVIGAFGGLLLRESERHFREADTAEDVALSLKALVPGRADDGATLRRAALAPLLDRDRGRSLRRH